MATDLAVIRFTYYSNTPPTFINCTFCAEATFFSLRGVSYLMQEAPLGLLEVLVIMAFALWGILARTYKRLRGSIGEKVSGGRCDFDELLSYGYGSFFCCTLSETCIANPAFWAADLCFCRPGRGRRLCVSLLRGFARPLRSLDSFSVIARAKWIASRS